MFKKQHPFLSLLPHCKGPKSQPRYLCAGMWLFMPSIFGFALAMAVNFYCSGWADTLPEKFVMG